MKAHHSPQHRPKHLPAGCIARRDTSRGVALVTTLLILMLLMAMTLAMTISVTSDTLINKYYRNARSSFYAADSGVNIARQFMISQIINSVTLGSSGTTAPIPASETAKVPATRVVVTRNALSLMRDLLKMGRTYQPGIPLLASRARQRCHPPARNSHAGQVPQPNPQACNRVRSPR